MEDQSPYNWAKSLLHRMNYVKPWGSSTAKMTVDNFEPVKDQFVFDVQAVVEMEIPPELVFNWDQTSISIVPGSSWTMETNNSCFLQNFEWWLSPTSANLSRQNDGMPPTIQLLRQLACDLHTESLEQWRQDEGIGWAHNHTLCDPKTWRAGMSVWQASTGNFWRLQRTANRCSEEAWRQHFRWEYTHKLHRSFATNGSQCEQICQEFMRTKFRDWYSSQVQDQLDDQENIWRWSDTLVWWKIGWGRSTSSSRKEKESHQSDTKKRYMWMKSTKIGI